MENIASFDVGHKSLSACQIRYDPNIMQNVNWWIAVNWKCIAALDQLDDLSPADQKVLTSAFIQQAAKLVGYFQESFELLYLSRTNVISGKKMSETNIVERAQAIRSALMSIDADMPEVRTILLEDQTINRLSSEIVHQIAFHYVKSSVAIDKYVLVGDTHDTSKVIDRTNVVIRDPRAKNRMCLGVGLDLGTFYAITVDLYEANKKHAYANFERFINLFGNSRLRRRFHRLGTRKGRDVADSFMQALAFICQV